MPRGLPVPKVLPPNSKLPPGGPRKPCGCGKKLVAAIAKASAEMTKEK